MNFETDWTKNKIDAEMNRGVIPPHLYTKNVDSNPANLVLKIKEARSKLSIEALDIFNCELSEIDEVYKKESEGTLSPQQLAKLNDKYRTNVEKILATKK